MGPLRPHPLPFVLLLLTLGLPLRAQVPLQRAEQLLTPTELRADLQQLRHLIQKKHPAPYRYTTRARMDQWFDSLSNTLNAPTSARAFLASITTLYPLLGDGHTLFLPADEGAEHSYLPIDVLLLGDSLFVRCDGPAGSGVHAGDRILSINESPAEDVVRALMERQVRDGYNATYPAWILDQWFRAYYRFAFGEPTHFEVRLHEVDGPERSTRVPALPLDSIRARWPSCRQEAPGSMELTWPDTGIAMLVIPSFETAMLTNANGKPADQLRAAFARIRERGVDRLVLDLRGNQGGDPALAKLLLAHLLTEPFTLVAEGPASGTTGPVAVPYAGTLYTLMDGGSFSATGMVLAQLEMQGRGALIGEEAGGGRTVLSGSARTTRLTHTRIACTVSRKTWQLLPRADDGHGVRPTHSVAGTVSDHLRGRDAAMEESMRLIRTGQ
ncbi:MAG: hypothetical protein IT229_10660 [Flavobacteriales bacterium]|nr:hypothetical protein [Flavobacteriales bacterium]